MSPPPPPPHYHPSLREVQLCQVHDRLSDDLVLPVDVDVADVETEAAAGEGLRRDLRERRKVCVLYYTRTHARAHMKLMLMLLCTLVSYIVQAHGTSFVLLIFLWLLFLSSPSTGS